MNKYLEKVAGLIPRYVQRTMKEGIPSMLKDLKGTGARAARAEGAKGALEGAKKKVQVAQAQLGANKNFGKATGKPPTQNTFIGNSEAAIFRAKTQTNWKGLDTRIRRTEEAAKLGRKSALGNAKRMAVGSGISATGITAAVTSKSKDE